jgi:hypothetical protein
MTGSIKWACVFNGLANLQIFHNVLVEFDSDTAIKAVLINLSSGSIEAVT